MITVVAGFVVGFICLLIKSAVIGTDGEGAWKVVEAIFFQDITATKDIEGLGLNSDLCMIGYSLILAMNYLPGMAVITLNVIGDAATNVIVCAKEHCLNKEIYNSKTPKNK